MERSARPPPLNLASLPPPSLRHVRPMAEDDYIPPNSAFDLDDDAKHRPRRLMRNSPVITTTTTTGRRRCGSWLSGAADTAHAATCALLLTILARFLSTTSDSGTAPAVAAIVFLAVDLVLDVSALSLALAAAFSSASSPWWSSGCALATRWLCGLLYLVVLVVALAAYGLLPVEYRYWGLGSSAGGVLVYVLLSVLAYVTPRHPPTFFPLYCGDSYMCVSV